MVQVPARASIHLHLPLTGTVRLPVQTTIRAAPAPIPDAHSVAVADSPAEAVTAVVAAEVAVSQEEAVEAVDDANHWLSSNHISLP